MRWITIFMLAGVASAQGAVTYEKELAPVAFLVGEFQGEGTHPWGPYEETLEGEWAQNKTLIVVRSKSTMGGRTVFEDLRVFSFDGERIRARQYAMGWVRAYDVRVDGEKVVLEEAAREGAAKTPWRYTFEQEADGFAYRVDALRDSVMQRYVSGELRRAVRDPGAQGEHAFGMVRMAVPAGDGRLAAQIHFPRGDGPFPVVIFSPGGDARTASGYETFGKWFASWGYVAVVVAFSDSSHAERAKKFGTVLDWLAERNAADTFPLKGKLDLERVVAAGHSRGGAACVIAARTDPRFAACLALAPSGPGKRTGEHAPPTMVIVGGDDRFLAAGRAVHEQASKPRYLVTIEGMDHMFRPTPAYRKLIARATAFLNYRVGKDGRYRRFLVQETDGVTVTAGE